MTTDADVTHPTSLALWNIPTPVVLNRPFQIMVGTKCASGCDLRGQRVTVHDETGRKVGEGLLGNAPWSQPGRLYGVAVTLPAPPNQGCFSWSAQFNNATSPQHQETSTTFSFRVDSPPEHDVTVTVHDEVTGTPIAHAQVALDHYQTHTDEQGQATLAVPTGDYELEVWKPGYRAQSNQVSITGNTPLTVATGAITDSDPDTERLWM